MISPSPYLLRTAEGWCKGASDSVELLPTAEAGDLPAVEQHSTRDPMYAATGHCTVVYARRRQRTVRLPEARALLRLRVVKSQRGALAPKYHQDHPQTGHRVRFACAVRLVRGRVSSSAAAASASAIRGQSCCFGFLCVSTRCAIGRAFNRLHCYDVGVCTSPSSISPSRSGSRPSRHPSTHHQGGFS